MGNYCSERPKYINGLVPTNISTTENSYDMKLLETYIQQAEKLKDDCSYSEALKKYDKALKFINQHGETNIQLKGFLLHEMAIIHMKLEDFEEAKNIFKLILSVFTNNYKIKLDEASNIYIELKEYIFDFAVLLFESKQFERSLFYFKFVLKMQDDQNQGFISEIHNYMGILFMEFKDNAAAKVSFEAALKLRKNLQKDSLDIFICNNLGLLSEKELLFDQAQLYYEQSFTIYKETSGEIDENFQKILNSLARVYQQKGEVQKAKYFYEEITTLFKGKNSLELASAYNNLGYLCEISKDMKNSIHFYKEALKIKRSLLNWNDKRILITLNNLILIFMDLKDYEQAKNYSLKAYEIKKSIPDFDILELSDGLYYLGIINFKIKEMKKSEKDLTRALKYFEDFLPKNDLKITSTHNYLGKLYLIMKNYQAAQFHLEEVEKYSKDDIEILESLIGLFHCYKSNDDHEKSKEFYIKIKEKSKILDEVSNKDNSLILALNEIVESN